MRTYTMTGITSITTKRRADDWIAYLNGDARVWEASPSEVEAIGRLVLRLHCEAENDRARQEAPASAPATPPAEEAAEAENDLRLFRIDRHPYQWLYVLAHNRQETAELSRAADLTFGNWEEEDEPHPDYIEDCTDEFPESEHRDIAWGKRADGSIGFLREEDAQ